MFKRAINRPSVESRVLPVDNADEHASLAWAPQPFMRWHLRRKYEVMEMLFRRLIKPHAKLVDMGCGAGEALVLAQRCAPDCELWGVDLDRQALDTAQARIPTAKLIRGDITKAGILPTDYFDIVHEFGAAFQCKDWQALARNYLSLLKPGGLLLWELPQKWSTAHLSYLLRVAPSRYEGESKVWRIARSVLPWKYRFESDAKIRGVLNSAGCAYEILEGHPLWYFFARGWSSHVLDFGWNYFGDSLFDRIDHLNGIVWPRYSGFYLIIQRSANDAEPHGKRPDVSLEGVVV